MLGSLATRKQNNNLVMIPPAERHEGGSFPGTRAGKGDVRLRILLVEDNPADVRLTVENLRDHQGRFQLTSVSTIKEAIGVLEHSPVDVTLLDLSLPDSSGLESFKRVRRDAPDVAIVVLTGLEDEELAAQTLEMGGQDYLVKGEVGSRSLVRSITYAQKRKHLENQLRHLAKHLQESHAALKETQLQLIQAEKMESLGKLATGVAHELKNPLARILLSVDYLSPGFAPDDPNVHGVIKEIRSSALRADEIIRSMLEFSWAGGLSADYRDINEIVRRASLLVEHEFIKRNVCFVTSFDEGIPLCRVDESKMEQVLVNLFINGMEAMEGKRGGHLTVETGSEILGEIDRSGKMLTGGDLRAGDRVVAIRISDEGPGVPADLRERIFDPFYTTRPAGKGTGLGLTVCQRIVALHQGLINFEDRPGGGATVVIRLKAVLQGRNMESLGRQAGAEPSLSLGAGDRSSS